MSTKLYVGNLSYHTSDEDLRSMFSSAGTVTSVTTITDQATGRSRGFAFVEMETPEGAKEAISQFNGKTVDNREIVVNEARPREKRGPREGGRDYGGGGGGRNWDNGGGGGGRQRQGDRDRRRY